MRHAPILSDMDHHQAAYVTARREAIVRRVDEQLQLAESREKRARPSLDEYAKRSKRIKLPQGNSVAAIIHHGTTFLISLGLTDISRQYARNFDLASKPWYRGIYECQ